VKETPHEAVPQRGVQSPHERVAPRAPADDEIGLARERHEFAELGEVELQVGVGQQHHGMRAASKPLRSASP
jgi:hypothetical protein